jgi:dihydrofolate reductase
MSHMTMSLDGYIANPDDQVDELFDWYGAGDRHVTTANRDVAFNVDDASFEMLDGLLGNLGALISGRHLFDMTDGWGDMHPAGAPVVVVTHTGAPANATERWPRTTFVDRVDTAVAKAREIAGDQDVMLMSPSVIGGALDLGLVDEVWVSLVPVVFGEGKQYFPKPAHGHLLFDDPEVVQGRRAVHLRYPVRR